VVAYRRIRRTAMETVRSARWHVELGAGGEQRAARGTRLSTPHQIDRRAQLGDRSDAGISSQWSTAAAIRSVMAMSSARGASTMMAATRASTSRTRPRWAVSDLLTHADGTRRSRRVRNTKSHCHLLVTNPPPCQDDGVAYAWDIPAWAACQACNTSADWQVTTRR
jgi:hypothetical protein